MAKWIVGLVALVWAAIAFAQSPDLAPDALAKRVTEDVLATIRSDKDLRAGNHEKVIALVEAKVLPHFDFVRMTRLAVGAPWRQATPAQQQSLANEFQSLLVHTYTNAFTAYKDETIEYRPLKLESGATETVVRSVVRQANKPDPIEVNYSMEKTDQGWKVYDVAIAGISLVQNYRSSFNSEIQRSGIPGLINSLAAKNKTLAQAPSK